MMIAASVLLVGGVLLPATSALASSSGWGLTLRAGVGYYADPDTGLSYMWAGPHVLLDGYSDMDPPYTFEYSLNGGPWTPYVDKTVLPVDSVFQAVHTVSQHALYPTGGQSNDLTNRFAIDNVGPTTVALSPGKAHRLYPKATFRFTLRDKGSEQDYVTIKIKKLGGKVMATYKYGQMPINSTRSMKKRLFIPKGTYRWFVYASDSTGNRQVVVGRHKLVVL